MDYEEDLKIDQESLDQEWLKQPQLYFKYAKLAVDADKEMGKAKELLETTRAETDSEVRQEAKDNEAKITEKIVESAILQDKKYLEAVDNFNLKKHELGILRAAVTAIEHRKSALENLVKLWFGGYFSKPIEPKESNIKEKIIDRADEKQVKNLNRRK